MDDIFRDGIYHPGAPTISAALALAQANGASGEQFLRAVIVGYEISTRIGAAMGRAHYRYWHNTGTIGVFGACAACSELLGLDATRYIHDPEHHWLGAKIKNYYVIALHDGQRATIFKCFD